MALFHHYLLLAFRCSGPLFLVVPINKGPEIKSNSTANVSQIELLNKVIPARRLGTPKHRLLETTVCKSGFFCEVYHFHDFISPILLKY
jgi:hypothetical protein